jgi:hypothetical protein
MPIVVTLNGAQTITHYKNIRGKTAGGGLVYMGGGGAAPLFANGAILPGIHDGRWVAPGASTAVSTTGSVGRFLAVTTPTNTPSVNVGDVAILAQHGQCTHLVVIASVQHQVSPNPPHGYKYYRWMYVLAMGAFRVPWQGRPAFFRAGASYISHAASNFPNKDVFRQDAWNEFAASPGNLLGNRSITVPGAPTIALTYPATYP